MNYEEKYKQYKKMYLQLKSQDGGAIQLEKNKLNELLQSDKSKPIKEKINKKFSYSTTIQDYSEIIALIIKHCETNFNSSQDIKNSLKEIYNKLGNARINRFRIRDVVRDDSFSSCVDWVNYNKTICKHFADVVIPYIKKEQGLQLAIIMMLLDVDNNTKSKIDIEQYMTYARNNNIIDKVKLVEGQYDNKTAMDVLKGFVTFSQNNAEYWQIQSQQTNKLIIGINNTPNTASHWLQKQGENGHPCIGPCTLDFSTNTYKCRTEPYKYGLFGKRNWDTCQINSNANNTNNTNNTSNKISSAIVS